ncbi:MAG TPA: hypothetical protein VFA10_20150, partial [Ktedonobacteraceae bacterium]|nr:hypothetical protein [Ktedonobacteraceae bacterium]
MVTMTVQELVCMIICLLLLGMILGMLLALLLWQVTLPGKICAQKKTRRRLVYMVGDVRRTIGALQQLQALIGREVAEGDPGLGDIVHFIRSMQRLFGKKASLEGVIQV